MSCYCFCRKILCARDSLPLVFKDGATVSKGEARAASGRQLLQKLEMVTKFDKSNRKAMNRNWSNQKAYLALKTKDSKFEFKKLNSTLAH